MDEGAGLKGKRILVIEDEFLVALEITSALEGYGFEHVRHVDNEKDAIRQIESDHWDTVVADANLNGRSIEGVASLLKERRVPFVIVTGYQRRALPPAICDSPVIEKPFNTNDLRRIVAGLCGA